MPASDLASDLVRLEQALRAYGAPIAEALRPGLAADYVTHALTVDGLVPHDDVITWFGWHDAADTAPPERDEVGTVIRYGGETVLVGPWWMLDLDRALASRRLTLEVEAEVGQRLRDDALVPKSWLPLATTEGAGELCIDTAAAGPAPLWISDPETQSDRTSPQFTSLRDFANALVRVLEEGFVVPHPHDHRAPMVDYPRLPEDLRRLATW